MQWQVKSYNLRLWFQPSSNKTKTDETTSRQIGVLPSLRTFSIEKKSADTRPKPQFLVFPFISFWEYYFDLRKWLPPENARTPWTNLSGEGQGIQRCQHLPSTLPGEKRRRRAGASSQRDFLLAHEKRPYFTRTTSTHEKNVSIRTLFVTKI